MSIYHTPGFIDKTGGYIIYINHGSVVIHVWLIRLIISDCMTFNKGFVIVFLFQVWHVLSPFSLFPEIHFLRLASRHQCRIVEWVFAFGALCCSQGSTPLWPSLPSSFLLSFPWDFPFSWDWTFSRVLSSFSPQPRSFQLVSPLLLFWQCCPPPPLW